MNLLEEFEKAMPMDEYMELLGDQKKLHDLHYKKVVVTEDIPAHGPLKILIITETWCGDSVAIIPVLTKIFENRPVEFRVALRDENDELINKFLTNGGKAIPIILIMDHSGDLLMRFGPRPKKVQAIFEEHRADIEAGNIERKTVGRKIRSFYAKDRGQAIKDEFLTEFKKALAQTGQAKSSA